MPPVLGPRSPSKAVLWSWAAARGMGSDPLERAKNETSSPVRNSSTTTRVPADPNALRSMHSPTAASASSRGRPTVAALPAAGPAAPLVAREGHEVVERVRRERDARRVAGDPRVARRRVEPLDQRALRELPDERGLASAPADAGHPHGLTPSVSGRRRAPRPPGGGARSAPRGAPP